MSRPFQKIVTGVVFFVVVVCVVAVTGYVAAGWDLTDAVYMVIITIFGVGYGEVQPVQSPALRALTIGVIVAGYAAVIYTVGGFVQMLVDVELNRALGARRMTKGIERMRNHTIVCGFGRIGRMLAQELSARSRPFVVIDTDSDLIQEAESLGFFVVHGDATDEGILQKAGIAQAAVLATVLSSDAANVFITITARDLNPDLQIIARGEEPATEKKLLKCGASRVVLPTAIGALKMAHLITRPTAESLLAETELQTSLNEELDAIGLHFDELRIGPGSPLAGRTIGDIEIHGNRGFLIVALRSADGTIALHPGAEHALAVDDTVIVLGHQDDLPQLAQRYVLQREITYRGATVGH